MPSGGGSSGGSLSALGPFRFAFDTPNVGTSGADLGPIASGLLVFGAYVIVRTAWLDSGTSKIGFYVFVSRTGSTDTITDYFGNAFDVGSPLVGSEPEQLTSGSIGPIFRGAMVTDSTSRVSVSAFGEVASLPLVAGTANVYLLAVPVTFP